MSDDGIQRGAILMLALGADEAAEVMRRARCQGAFIAEPHRIFQLRVTHALAVIEDQDSTAGAVPLELDANLACPGGDTVVDDVGQGRRC